MTEPSDPAPPGRPGPFDTWVGRARPRAKLWRVGLGALLALVIWVATTIVLVVCLIAWRVVGEGLEVEAAINKVLEDDVAGLTIPGSIMTLLTIGGLWLGTWASLGLFHKLRLSAVLSWERRIRWSEFGVGVLLGGAYLSIGLVIAFLFGEPPYRSELSVSAYLLAAAPLLAAILVQTSAEEAFFRGYLLQQLAARFRSPLIWGGVPALLFGLLHFPNGSGISLEFGLYYIAATFIMAVTATVMVWRTGGIAAAMGLHFINNAVVLLGVGTDDFLSSTQLYLWPADDMADIALWDLAPQLALLAYVASPWAPFPRARKVTLAEP